MKKIIKKLRNRIIRKVIVLNPVIDVYNKKEYYPYRWELFKRYAIKTGYIERELYDWY